MGVVVRRYIRRYPHNNYYFSLLHLYYVALFLAAASLLLCSFLKCFFGLVCYFWAIYQTLLEEHLRLFKNQDLANMAI